MKTTAKFLVSTAIIISCIFSSILSNGDVSIFMRTSAKVKAGDTYRVDITINKTGIKGFSKFETQFPVGFEIEPIINNSSMFIFKNSVAKFIWIEMPTEQSIQISYNVRVPSNYQGNNTITGAFYYIFNNEKYSQNFSSLLSVYNEDVAKEIVGSEYAENMIININKSRINERINFNVQLAAFSKKISPEILAELYQPTIRIQEEFVDGLYKYYIGGFNTLNAAKEFKDYCGIKDAFIIAYYKNNKTTIIKALQIIEKGK